MKSIDVHDSPALAELVEQAAASSSVITLEANGKKAVVLSASAFENLVSCHLYQERGLLSEEEFRQGFGQALAEAGYDTREKILELVQDVKQELAEERSQRLSYLRNINTTPNP